MKLLAKIRGMREERRRRAIQKIIARILEESRWD